MIYLLGEFLGEQVCWRESSGFIGQTLLIYNRISVKKLWHEKTLQVII